MRDVWEEIQRWKDGAFGVVKKEARAELASLVAESGCWPMPREGTSCVCALFSAVGTRGCLFFWGS